MLEFVTAVVMETCIVGFETFAVALESSVTLELGVAAENGMGEGKCVNKLF